MRFTRHKEKDEERRCSRCRERLPEGAILCHMCGRIALSLVKTRKPPVGEERAGATR